MPVLVDLDPLSAAVALPGGRAWLARDAGGWRSSHPELAPVADWLAHETPDEDGHEVVFLARGPDTGALFGAFLHRTCRGQAQGGLRRWPYPDFRAFLSDGLRLSRGMSLKSALAGLWWGGGKGLIAAGGEAKDAQRRRSVYREYGDFVSALAGAYVTAEDAGTTPADIAAVFERTRFVTCIPEEMGGRGDPSPDTARGVLAGIEAALACCGLGDIAGRRFSVQGAGRVGAAVIDGLVQRGAASVVVAESQATRARALAGRWDGAPVSLMPAEAAAPDILAEPADVFVPCALGGILGPDTIGHLKASIVCGAANNPLLDERRDAEALRQAGITYVPDYIANRLGIVRVADEHSGRLRPDPAIERHLDSQDPLGIPAVVHEVLERSRREARSTVAVAEEWAEALSHEPHPIFGDRATRLWRACLPDFVARSDPRGVRRGG